MLISPCPLYRKEEELLITTCHNVAKCCAFSKAAYEIVEKEKEIKKRHKHHVRRLSGLTLWLESCKIRADWFVGKPQQTCCCDMSRDDDFRWVHHSLCCTRKRKSSGLSSGLQMIILGQRQMWYAYGNFWGLSRLSKSSTTRVNCKRAGSWAWSCLVICPFLSQGFIDVGQRAPKNMSFAVFLLLTFESSPLKMTSPLLIWAHIWSGCVELCAGYYWSEHRLLLG